MSQAKVDYWPYLKLDFAFDDLHEEMMNAKAIVDPVQRRLAEERAWRLFENSWRTFLRDTADRP